MQACILISTRFLESENQDSEICECELKRKEKCIAYIVLILFIFVSHQTLKRGSNLELINSLIYYFAIVVEIFCKTLDYAVCPSQSDKSAENVHGRIKPQTILLLFSLYAASLGKTYFLIKHNWHLGIWDPMPVKYFFPRQLGRPERFIPSCLYSFSGI